MIKFFFLIQFLVASFTVNASNLKVIYGADNRLNYYEASSKFQRLADSTAGMVRADALKSSGSYYKFKSYQFGGRLIGNMWENAPVCMSERFSDELTLPGCSGFLVGRDILVTAGHCVTSERSCKSIKWVFGYNKDVSKSGRVKKDQVYSCKRILKRGDRPKDFAILKLDRVVQGRSALKISKTNSRVGDKISSIGHPAGLPTKITTDAKVFSTSKNTFKTNLDTFKGSSGSVVLNENSKVVGILVRGAEDFVKDERQGCYKVNTCRNNPSRGSCSGEEVTHISVIGLSRFL